MSVVRTPIERDSDNGGALVSTTPAQPADPHVRAETLDALADELDQLPFAGVTLYTRACGALRAAAAALTALRREREALAGRVARLEAIETAASLMEDAEGPDCYYCGSRTQEHDDDCLWMALRAALAAGGETDL